jgi:hypothetical protein
MRGALGAARGRRVVAEPSFVARAPEQEGVDTDAVRSTDGGIGDEGGGACWGCAARPTTFPLPTISDSANHVALCLASVRLDC